MQWDNLRTALEIGDMHDTQKCFKVPSLSGTMINWGTTVPSDGTAGYAKSSIFIDTDASSDDLRVFVNSGSGTSCQFTPITSVAGADFGATGLLTDVIAESTSSNGVSLSNNTTVASGKTLAVTTADKATVGGVIVPQYKEISFLIMPHASLTTRDLFYANEAWQVTNLTAVPCLVEGGARTAVISKATGNSAPASGTTPLHTGSIDCNATAYTPQVLSLTATGSDLQLAATNRIGITFNAAMATGVLAGTIRMKRI